MTGPDEQPTVIGPPADLTPDPDTTQVIPRHAYTRPPPTRADRRRNLRWPVALIVSAGFAAAVAGVWLGTASQPGRVPYTPGPVPAQLAPAVPITTTAARPVVRSTRRPVPPPPVTGPRPTPPPTTTTTTSSPPTNPGGDVPVPDG